MNKRTAIAVALSCALSAACGNHSPQGPPRDSTLQVYVHWQDQGLAGKRLEVLELGLEAVTDSIGTAEFVIPAGDHTLRAYDINTGGPARAYVDFSVATVAHQTTRVEIIDCWTCDAGRVLEGALPSKP